MNYQYKHLVGAMIVAGWDEAQGGQVRRAGAPWAPAAPRCRRRVLLRPPRRQPSSAPHRPPQPHPSPHPPPRQVYGCPIGGTISREPWTTDGSGSTFLWGFLDSEFK